jgi:hypothetical protein
MRDKSKERLELLKLAESMSEVNVEKVLIFVSGIESQERNIHNYGPAHGGDTTQPPPMHSGDVARPTTKRETSGGKPAA